MQTLEDEMSHSNLLLASWLLNNVPVQFNAVESMSLYHITYYHIRRVIVNVPDSHKKCESLGVDTMLNRWRHDARDISRREVCKRRLILEFGYYFDEESPSTDHQVAFEGLPCH